MRKSLIPVDPVQPVAPWIGGKRNLAKRICTILDTIPCTTYTIAGKGRAASAAELLIRGGAFC